MAELTFSPEPFPASTYEGTLDFKGFRHQGTSVAMYFHVGSRGFGFAPLVDTQLLNRRGCD
ncbi:hypothetical protein HZB02_02435 [Candidatus Woesearchaeota archaeon]|nr:hypothetical protein [Candidatus Woesearchaeota archaeon]